MGSGVVPVMLFTVLPCMSLEAPRYYYVNISYLTDQILANYVKVCYNVMMVSSTIEIGHTYAPDLLVPSICALNEAAFEFSDTPYAGKLRAIAYQIGKDATRVAFVDDIAARNEQRKSADGWRWELFIQRSAQSVRVGTEASIIAFESEYVQRGRELVEEISTMELSSGYRMSDNQQKLVVGSGKTKTRIPLVGFKGIEDESHPSCQVLDLAWLEHRLTIASEAITVLPVKYESQQNQVKLLADLFPHLSSEKMTNYFIADSQILS